MKAILVATLLVFSMAAVAGGNNERQGAPEGNWPGDPNMDDVARTLTVKCPVDTMADSIEAVSDDEGVAIVIECNYTN